MKAIKQNIPTGDRKILKGDTFTLRLNVEIDDGDPKDLTGADIHFGVSNYPGSSFLIEKEVTEGITIDEPLQGEASIKIESEDTRFLSITESRRFWYRVKVTDLQDNTATVASGYITIYDDEVVE